MRGKAIIACICKEGGKVRIGEESEFLWLTVEQVRLGWMEAALVNNNNMW